MIQAKSVNLNLIAQYFPNTKSESAYKRLQRFIKQISLPQDKLAYLVASILKLDKRGSWQLVFDRTNWKVGKKHINILFLAVCAKGISIPLFFTLLEGKKSGNSNQNDRILLMNKFIKTFGKKCVGLILGDREFIGKTWITYLNQAGLPFCIRLKEGWQKIWLEKAGRSLEAKQCFKGLKKGQTKSLGRCLLGAGKDAVRCFITGMKNEKGDWIVLAHSQGIEDPCETYRKRWQIERMFFSMKTGGFNLEDTHITEPKRLECLLGILSIAYAICYKAGEFTIIEAPPKPKKHGYPPKSIFHYGFEKIIHAIAQIPYKFSIFRRLFTQIFSHVRISKQFFVL